MRAGVILSWISLGLTASPTSLPANGTTTLTATASLDVGPTPYFIELFHQTSNAQLFVCKSGASCSFSVTQTARATLSYIAYVGRIGATGTAPPPDVRATSGRWP